VKEKQCFEELKTVGLTGSMSADSYCFKATVLDFCWYTRKRQCILTVCRFIIRPMWKVVMKK